MGKRAFRKKLAAKLKAKGIRTKLYRGNKKVAWRSLSTRNMKLLFYRLDFVTPGQLVHDCYGANFHIKGLMDNPWCKVYGGNNTFVADIYQVKYVEGIWSCGCPNSPEESLTREEIEAYLQAYYESPESAQWVDEEWRDRILAQLRAGHHILDEEGVYLPEFARY